MQRPLPAGVGPYRFPSGSGLALVSGMTGTGLAGFAPWRVPGGLRGGPYRRGQGAIRAGDGRQSGEQAGRAGMFEGLGMSLGPLGRLTFGQGGMRYEFGRGEGFGLDIRRNRLDLGAALKF